MKNKVAYIVLALLLGGVGVHELYRGKTSRFLLMLLFCWTGIPALIALVQCFMAAFGRYDEEMK